MKAVGFDLDDTLIAEALFLKSGIRHISHRLHEQYPEIAVQRVVQCMDAAVMNGLNHYSALENLLASCGLSDRVDMKDVVAEFRRHKPDPSIYHLPPSIEIVLNRLKKSEFRLFLITDGRSETQRNKIEAARLERFFDPDDIFISAETGHDKYAPDTFLHVMQKYPEADEFHYIGDNLSKDFLHPSRLGWHCHHVHPFPLAITNH